MTRRDYDARNGHATAGARRCTLISQSDITYASVQTRWPHGTMAAVCAEYLERDLELLVP